MACSICGETSTTTHSFDAAGHCTVCGYTPHVHTWQYNGEAYNYEHGLRCTSCDAASTENHIYGSDGNCTVCGNAPPHEHQWKWNGEKGPGRGHTVICACGESMLEQHRLGWDGKYRDDKWHGMICNVCGYTETHGHWYSTIYVNGDKCLDCGYEKVKHTWQYNNFCNEDGHDMICSDCGVIKPERHSVNSSGKCMVCGYEVKDTTGSEVTPSETKPTQTETESTVAEPTEAEFEDITATETDSVETEPTQTTSEATKATEDEPNEAKNVETEDVQVKATASENVSAVRTNVDAEQNSKMWIWVVAVVVATGGLGAFVLIRKKK